jgi:uracil-DNA glycosylase
MQRPAVSGGAVVSKVMIVGQAPGSKEPLLGRPFAWTAGRTLFGWFERECGRSEAEVRGAIYFAAVCRCFPGRTRHGGDRVPDPDEVRNCRRWLEAEIAILDPALVIPVGRLAIAQFIEFEKMADIIGKQFRVEFAGYRFDLIPLPHPSGASPWHRIEPGRTLLELALRKVAAHSAWPAGRADLE